MSGVPSPAEAAVVLKRALPTGSHRLAHSLAVGRKAEAIAGVLEPERARLVVAAAFLHDIGYAEAATDTGMHQLDGARHLRGLGGEDRLCRLVAHHTFARIEARNKRLDGVLEAEFPPPDGTLVDLLDLVTFCDLTTSSAGEPVTVAARFAGIFERYAPQHVVAVTMREAEPFARDLVERVQQRVDEAGAHERDAVSEIR
ncbi:HD domain-containing protein [Myceligenerans halotolerans]